MPRSAHLLLFIFGLVIAGCASLPVENAPALAGDPLPTAPVRWRVGADCMRGAGQAPGMRREALAAGCRRPVHDMISIALSGGGTKAAVVFSGEALFYLDFLGLLERTSLISAVSGRSFAGSIYALSCDPSTPCQNFPPNGRERPLWSTAPS
jgi:hypothetical protein